MSDARKKVLDQIRKKAKKINELRTNSSRSLTCEEVVHKFFRDIEEIYVLAITPSDFQVMLENKSKIFESRMKSFDAGVDLELMWNETQDWREFRLQGVVIKWSEVYLKANPNQTKDMYIDVTNMFINMI